MSNKTLEKWEEKTIDEIAYIKGGKRLPKGEKLTVEKTTHPYIRVTDFNDLGTIDIGNVQFITDSIYEQIKNYTITSKDLYISIAGTIGKTGIIPKELDGANLIVELPLTPWEAALGCNIEVESIDSKVLITIPAGIQSGEKLRIASHGYYDGYGLRGDLLAEIKIVVPKQLTKEETQLYKQLKNISCFSPRKN